LALVPDAYWAERSGIAALSPLEITEVGSDAHALAAGLERLYAQDNLA
jgi:hypothetical protein